jgi:hypothetical protein
MLSVRRKSEHVSCINDKGENFSAESLFLLLILQQQKMINELVAKLREVKNDKRAKV